MYILNGNTWISEHHRGSLSINLCICCSSPLHIHCYVSNNLSTVCVLQSSGLAAAPPEWRILKAGAEIHTMGSRCRTNALNPQWWGQSTLALFPMYTLRRKYLNSKTVVHVLLVSTAQQMQLGFDSEVIFFFDKHTEILKIKSILISGSIFRNLWNQPSPFLV